MHGDLRIYTGFVPKDEENDWVEHRIRFTEGRLSTIDDVPEDGRRRSAETQAKSEHEREQRPKSVPRGFARKVVC
ncbi:hypothetical protein [Nesterenkonia ebinurensis]|uniref:hypothetical protein n=1 Tax=Nesterenkonia ebinurensis TaxID=2608252 RepID=UPI00123DCFD7|nr:hypothetical protein [Nesterenkonia ebinurensis]